MSSTGYVNALKTTPNTNDNTHYILIFLIAIIVIIVIYSVINRNKKSEGYVVTSSVKKLCANCGDLNPNQCSTCSNCGYCYDMYGRGKCVPGGPDGPLYQDDRDNCITYDYDDASYRDVYYDGNLYLGGWYDGRYILPYDNRYGRYDRYRRSYKYDNDSHRGNGNRDSRDSRDSRGGRGSGNRGGNRGGDRGGNHGGSRGSRL